MFRKLALVGVITAAALTGCATYDQYGYGGQQGRGDYYYGRPQVSSSVGVSIGNGYGYPYGNGYYGAYGPYAGYGAYGYPSYGYGGGYGYPSYGYPGYGYGYGSNYPYRPPVRPRPPRPDNVDRGNQQRPAWRDIEGIKNRNEPRPDGRYIQQSARQMPQVREESRSSERSGSFSGAVQRARSTNREKPIEP